MKKFINCVMLLILMLIISVDVVRAKGISVSCPVSAKPGTSFTCNIDADYSEKYGGVEAIPQFSSGLTLGKFSIGSSYNLGDFTSYKVSVIANDDLIGNSKVGSFTVNMNKDVTDTQSITFTEVKLVDSNSKNVFCDDVTVTIKVDTSTDNSSSNNSSSNNSSSSGNNSFSNNYKSSNDGSNENESVSKKISSIKLSSGEIEFDKDINEYSIEVDNNVTDISFDISLEDSKASYTLEGNNDLEVGENIITITVKGYDGSSNIYTIIVNRLELSNNSFLKSLEIKNYKLNFDKKKFEYYLIIGKESSLDIIATPEDVDAIVVIGGNEKLKTGSNINIVVKAPDGSTSMYSIKVFNSNSLRFIYGLIGMILSLIIVYSVLLVARKRRGRK